MTMKRLILLALTLTVAGFVVACGDSDEAGNNGQQVDTTRATLTDDGNYFVEYAPSPDPIPHNELFTMEVSVWETDAKEAAVTAADVAVDATMPAHGHGMNTEPSVTANGDGTFTVEGMKLHMESPTPAEKWVLAVDVTEGESTETASFDIMCCGE
jgi:hypothetical protein